MAATVGGKLAVAAAFSDRHIRPTAKGEQFGGEQGAVARIAMARDYGVKTEFGRAQQHSERPSVIDVGTDVGIKYDWDQCSTARMVRGPAPDGADAGRAARAPDADVAVHVASQRLRRLALFTRGLEFRP